MGVGVPADLNVGGLNPTQAHPEVEFQIPGHLTNICRDYVLN
jgi:hypothetical protein